MIEGVPLRDMGSYRQLLVKYATGASHLFEKCRAIRAGPSNVIQCAQTRSYDQFISIRELGLLFASGGYVVCPGTFQDVRGLPRQSVCGITVTSRGHSRQLARFQFSDEFARGDSTRRDLHINQS